MWSRLLAIPSHSYSTRTSKGREPRGIWLPAGGSWYFKHRKCSRVTMYQMEQFSPKHCLVILCVHMHAGVKESLHLKDLHWLPIRKRIEFKILLLTFKCMQGCAPLYLRELLVKQANTRTLRSNTKNLLQIPLTNLKKFGDRAFCAYAPRLWNELPDNIKAADSVQNFKKQLKTLLFRKEFN